MRGSHRWAPYIIPSFIVLKKGMFPFTSFHSLCEPPKHIMFKQYACDILQLRVCCDHKFFFLLTLYQGFTTPVVLIINYILSESAAKQCCFECSSHNIQKPQAKKLKRAGVWTRDLEGQEVNTTQLIRIVCPTGQCD